LLRFFIPRRSTRVEKPNIESPNFISSKCSKTLIQDSTNSLDDPLVIPRRGLICPLPIVRVAAEMKAVMVGAEIN
jgi:hypothetical protein